MAEKNKRQQFARPFLKWAGGKRQLIPVFERFLPKELLKGQIKNYYEPFLGSGAMFFFLVENFSFKNMILSDTNRDLVLTYLTIKNDVGQLINKLQDLQGKYLSFDKINRKEFYYSIRSDFNREKQGVNHSEYNINRAAKLIFLNKTCYNGLFRMNSKGEFNTPAGDYKNPKICDRDNLVKVSRSLKNVNIHIQDFRDITSEFRQNSFVYFDPPYRPLSKTSSFTSYNNSLFSDEDQIALSNIFIELDEIGGKLMLSNSDPKNVNKNDSFFDNLYKNFTINRIPAKRSINSKADKRGYLKELLITNY